MGWMKTPGKRGEGSKDRRWCRGLWEQDDVNISKHLQHFTILDSVLKLFICCSSFNVLSHETGTLISLIL